MRTIPAALPASIPLLAAVMAMAAACGTSVPVPGQGDGAGGDDSDVPSFVTRGEDTAGGAGVGPGVKPDGTPNSPPGPAQVSIAPAAPGTLDVVEAMVDIEAVDPDGYPEPITYHYSWFRNEQPTLHSEASIPAEVTQRGDLWRVEVRAFDGLAEGDAASAEVEIVNSAPVLESVEIDPPVALTTTLLVCDAGQRWDPDGDDVSLDYWWYRDDDLIQGAVSSALAPPLDDGARYRCRAEPFDGQLHGEAVFSQEVEPKTPVSSEAVLAFQPKSLDLGTVLPGQTHTGEVVVLNIGDGPLELYGVQLGGDPVFDVEVGLPLTLEPAEEIVLTVSFATEDPGLKKGSLSFDSNAINDGVASVALLGVGAAPCLQVTPKVLDFGGAYVASHHEQALTLVSCGALPVTIEGIAMIQPADSPFVLDLAPGPGPLPWVLGASETVTIKVRFEPKKASPTDGEGNAVPESATVSIQLGIGQPLVSVVVTGFASALGCPMPVIDVEEGHYTSPGTLLHLHGTQSFAPGGKPTIYSWAVDPPPGVAAVPLDPSPDVESVTYPVEAFGPYLFQLKVFDEVEGEVIPGCTTATWTVTVKDAIPLIVELTWDTPGDADPTDVGPGKGADLDLHMHDGQGSGQDYDGDGAPDAWFDLKHDLYWFDTSPDWGEPGQDNDPMLVLEDPDGAGPERIEYHAPVKFETYTLGVHCWSSFEFGPSVATVRVFHYEELIATQTDVVLDSGDLWEVGTLLWPQGELIPSFAPAGGPKVTAGYPNPFQQ